MAVEETTPEETTAEEVAKAPVDLPQVPDGQVEITVDDGAEAAPPRVGVHQANPELQDIDGFMTASELQAAAGNPVAMAKLLEERVGALRGQVMTAEQARDLKTYYDIAQNPATREAVVAALAGTQTPAQSESINGGDPAVMKRLAELEATIQQQDQVQKAMLKIAEVQRSEPRFEELRAPAKALMDQWEGGNALSLAMELARYRADNSGAIPQQAPVPLEASPGAVPGSGRSEAMRRIRDRDLTPTMEDAVRQAFELAKRDAIEQQR